MSFRDSFFSDFFEEEPFGRMERMMNSMFDDPFFGGPRLSQRAAQGHHGHQAPRIHRDEPIIEEVDDHADTGFGHQRMSSGPIIEEPEDEGYPGNYQNNASSVARRNPRGHGASGASGVRINMGSGGIPEVTQYGNGMRTMFSYTSSTSSSSSHQGPGRGNPVVYSSSSTTRIGPGGVRETQSTVRDGRTGKESITISRALGERGRTITRTRDAQGHEESRDLLNNIDVDETAAFDAEWMHQASQNLPGSYGSRNGRGSHHPRLGY